MRKRNWSKYNKSLVKRGSITFYIEAFTLRSSIEGARKRGRPRSFSHPLLQVLLILKIQYHLSYRGLEGFAKEILSLLVKDLILPTYSLICRRAKELEKKLPRLTSRRASTLIIDSTGFKVYGEGEWKVKLHGQSKRREWIKLHLALDESSQEVVALEVSSKVKADCQVGADLIRRCRGKIKCVKGDGAYDTKKVRECASNKGARVLIPPKRNGKISEGNIERNQALQEIRGLGGDEVGKRLWGKLTGYSKRVLVETAFSRMKKIFGGSFFSREMMRQKVEGYLKCWMLNEMMKKAA